MTGKNILITGATSGIGESIARHFSSLGASVILVGRNREKMEQLTEKLGRDSLFCPYDFLDMEHIEDIFLFCMEKGIKLDGLVHSAGLVNNGAIKGNEIEVMENIMKVNCFSFFELGKFFSLKKYSNDQSSIVAISSIISLKSEKGLSQYAASKAALNSVVITMSKEFEKRKIRVNAILPGHVDTPMIETTKKQLEGFEESVLQMQPYGLIEPIQIAYLAEFLLSDKARFITGSLIPVTGGF